MLINCVIDNYIHLNPKDLPKNVLDEILNKLSVPNPVKKRAQREMIWGADGLPSYIRLWKYRSPTDLVLPRGFLSELESIVDLYINDNTSHYGGYHLINDPISLRDYQSKAVEKLVEKEIGIYKASTGAGKSRVMLELTRSLHQKTIIICEKSDLMLQWINFATDLGFEDIGCIGYGNWEDDCALTIALRQSLWLSKDLDKNWYRRFGMVILDENHHASSETMFELIQRFPARYRFGCSATPDSDLDLFPIVSAAIGPVVAHSTPEEIGDHLIMPSVKVVKTAFEFDYHPTYKNNKGRVIRNNYNSMMKALEEDDERNSLIAELVIKEQREGNVCLVLSKRKKHLDEIQNWYNNFYVWELDKFSSYYLTGDNSDDYMDIKDEIEIRDNGVLFSTLAEEGTDIPRLDRLFLTYPARKSRGVEQAIGRIMRPHPKKKDAIVYDFRDANVSLLNSQFRTRAQSIYHKRGYKVETLGEDEESIPKEDYRSFRV